MAITKHFNLDQGSDKSVYFVIKDKSGPVDLTGYQAAMQLRLVANEKTIVDTLTTDNDRINIVGNEGRIIVKFNNWSTNKYPVGLIKYDLEVESPNGDITRIVEGRIKVSQGITRVKSGKHVY